MATARSSDGCVIAFTEVGSGHAVLLIHGFASTLRRNWQGTGWMDALARAGFRAVAYDQRGHGDSDKRYEPDDYAPARLVDDAIAVLDAAGVDRAAVMGYSMGARVALEVALMHPARVRALIISGIGPRMRDFGAPSGDRELVARALEADDASGFPPSARFYRTFAEQNHQDRRALAACWRRPVRPVTAEELATIALPTLVTAGDRDTVAGDAAPLAQAIPGARFVSIPGKDHMTAVGAREHRRAVIEFLQSLP
jgi:pimeloyl-ACP methyl ester carboxylesterase